MFVIREGESKRKTTHSCTNQSEGDNHDVEEYFCGTVCAFGGHGGGGSKQGFRERAMFQAGYSAESGYSGSSGPCAFSQSIQVHVDQADGSCRRTEQRWRRQRLYGFARRQR